MMDNPEYITALITDTLGASPELTNSLYGGYIAQVRLKGQLFKGLESDTQAGALIALAELLEITPSQRATSRACPLFDVDSRQTNLI